MEGIFGPYGLNMTSPLNDNLFSNTQFPFITTLELPDLSRLVRNPILHNPSWLNFPTNIIINIPKFDKKPREDPTTHIITCHLWHVSNFMLHDSI